MIFNIINDTELSQPWKTQLLNEYLILQPEKEYESTIQTKTLSMIQGIRLINRFLTAVTYPRFSGLCAFLYGLLERPLALKTGTTGNL